MMDSFDSCFILHPINISTASQQQSFEKLSNTNLKSTASVYSYSKVKFPSAFRMDRAFREAQATDEAQPYPGFQKIQNSPLGMRLSRQAANTRRENPFEWHLRYWLSIFVLACLRGEDLALTLARIENEWNSFPEHAQWLGRELRTRWIKYQDNHCKEYTRQWAEITLESPLAKGLLGDLDRMLEGKALKTRVYLRRRETRMMDMLRDAKIPEARNLCNSIGQLYKNLLEEEATQKQQGSGSQAIDHELDSDDSFPEDVEIDPNESEEGPDSVG